MINHFAVVRYVGIAVGLGANVMLRHALRYPERVDSLMLVNCVTSAPGWIEWGYQKRNVNHLRQHGVTQVRYYVDICIVSNKLNRYLF